MRQRMERLVILPFSAGCISEASVAVGLPQPRRSRSVPNTPDDAIKGSKGIEDSEILSGEGMKNSMRLLDVVPKPNLSNGFNRLYKGFKNFSQLFVEKDEEEMDELEMDMEIGCPTDVQHVTHIGWDGITTTTNAPSSAGGPIMKGGGWDNLIPPELLSLSAHQSLHHHYEVPNLDSKHEISSSSSSSSPMKPSSIIN